jgi:hypothetical protein
LRRVLLDLVAEDIGIIVTRILDHRSKGHGRRTRASV